MTKPGYFKCTRAPQNHPHFTAGTVYEVHSYEGSAPLVATNKVEMLRLPQPNVEFVAYYPHGRGRI